MTTARVVAGRLAQAFAGSDYLEQRVAVDLIEREFGRAFLRENDAGNDAIDPKVLREFRKLTPDAVWIRSEFAWRKREGGESGRQVE